MAEIDEKTRVALYKLQGEFESFRHIEQQLQGHAELLEALELVAQRSIALYGREVSRPELDFLSIDHDGTGPSIAAALIRAAKETR